MNYLRDKDSIFTSKTAPKKNRLNFFIFIFVVVVAMYVVFFTGIFGSLSSGVISIATPLWKADSKISILSSSVYGLLSSKKLLIEKNMALEKEIEIMNLKLLDRNLLLEENIDLRKFLGRNISSKIVFASVMSRPNRTHYDTFIIDVGKNDGVKNGDNVLYAGNVVIGKITEVFSMSAKVLLFSSPGEENDVLIGSDRITAVAIGRGGGNFELVLPRDANIEYEDIAYSTTGNSYIIGTVKYIKESPSDPFKTILLSSPINIFKLKWVEVDVT